MDTLFAKKGRLDLVVTRGWISAWEASGLDKGSVVVGSSINAGQDAELTLDGRFVARGRLYILGGEDDGLRVGVKIESLEREAPADPEPERGNELTELLPFEIVYEGTDYSLAELEGVGLGTIVSLDRGYPDGDGAENLPAMTLLVAGKKAARGRAIVVGESMGMMIDECPPPSQRVGDPRITGSVINPGKERVGNDGAGKVKLYDWRRPDCFTRAQIRAIQYIHERALEILNDLLPEMGDITLKCVDQMTYEELIVSLPAKKRILSSNLGGRARDYEREAVPAKPARSLVQPANPRFPFFEGTAERVAAWNEGKLAVSERRPVLVFADGSASAIADSSGELFRALKAGWKPVADPLFAEPREEAEVPTLRSGEGGISGHDRGMLPYGMICLVGFECRGGSINIAYAAHSLTPVWKALERHGR